MTDTAISFDIRGVQSITIRIEKEFAHLSESDIADQLSNGELTMTRNQVKNTINAEDGAVVAWVTDFYFEGMTKSFEAFHLP